MRKAILMLMVCVRAYAADGYVKQVSLVDLRNENPKTGDVYKVRQFRADGTPDGERFAVELYSYRKTEERTVKLNLASAQWKRLELSSATAGNLFLRKTAEGWEFLGTEIFRDANGKTGFR